LLGNNKYLDIFFLNVPVDPVCGIELTEDLATILDFNNKKIYFCCEGCKKIFQKKPKKYSK
jgi:YHS domain-containing protein